MKRMQGFTLAEVLITLAIIGVVAAVAIPSVISNSQQQEFKTGLRKAVSVLNSAITMNMAMDSESPYNNANLFGYLMKHMAVIETTSDLSKRYILGGEYTNGFVSTYRNAAFYTTDGMRFEFRTGGSYKTFLMYESGKPVCASGMSGEFNNVPGDCSGCGAYGLNNNTDGTTKPPCLITVDVNGDRKPNPKNASCKSVLCKEENVYKYADPLGLKLTDMFTIMITDKQAIPYGIAAQRAMYQAQDSK